MEYEEEYESLDNVKEQAERSLENRQAVLLHLHQYGFKKVYQIFPEQVGIDRVSVKFEAATSIAYVSIRLQNEHVMPGLSVEKYIKLLDKQLKENSSSGQTRPENIKFDDGLPRSQ